ncbi:MAG: nucleotide-binding protein [Rhodococcus sp. (in: high G+C Gram-positive bacteria)]|uniref:nucleotide-binding protein n=1 Tax=Rhodococcus sp. TaxID=1831 RepID=UPI002ADC4F9C|nr:nucleotide-binding protein [Rhodococcus sp. (in: high G+C Gram-positive bacteria)]
MDTAQKIAKLNYQIETAPKFRGELSAWTAQTSTILRLILGADHTTLLQYNKISYSTNFSPSSDASIRNAFNSGVERGVSLIEAAITELEFNEPQPPSTVSAPAGNDIFIVHGHDEAHKLKVASFVEAATGLKPVLLSDRPNRGRTLFEKFEAEASNAGFAIVIATADDIGSTKTASSTRARARQNVILEWGYFAGKLGRERVTLLYESNVELPSDISGLAYTALDVAGAWRFELVRELKAAGIDASLDKAMSA